MRPRRPLLNLLPLIGLLAACGESRPAHPEWDLRAAFFGAGKLEIQAPPGPALERAERFVLLLVEDERLDVELLGPEDLGDARVPRIVFGSPLEDTAVSLLCSLGAEVDVEAATFRYEGRDYVAPEDGLVACFPDPERPGLPAVLVYGNEVGGLPADLEALPRPWQLGVRTFAGGELLLRADLDSAGAIRPDSRIDYEARRAEYWAGAEVVESEFVRIRSKVPPSFGTWGPYQRAMGKARVKTAAWLEPDEKAASVLAGRRLEIDVFDHYESFEFLRERVELGAINRYHPHLYLVLAEGFPLDGGAGAARLLARELAGDPAAPWMADGQAVAASGEWWGYGLADWVGFLHAGRLVPPLERLLAPDAEERLSPHILQPLRGFLFAHLATGPLKDKIPAIWAGAKIPWPQLERGFRLDLDRARAKVLGRLRQAPARRARIREAPPRHGIAVVDEPHAFLRSSYGARGLGESLARARELGADSASFWMSAYHRPQSEYLVALPHFQGSASAPDLALAAGMGTARELGFELLLSVQQLSEASGSWADAPVPVSPEGQQAFWGRVTSVATHYGLLAELLRVEILSLGSDLREAARTFPDRDAPDQALRAGRLSRWKKLISRLRGAFTGGLTYGGQLAQDAGTVAFWADLDFVGLNVFPAYGKAGIEPRDSYVRRVLSDHLDEGIGLANRWDRPLLLLQVGFPSRDAAWAHPDIPRGGVSPESQERFFGLLTEVLGADRVDREVLRGFYLWNWSTDPAAGGPQDGSFTPQNKSAEALLPALFAQ